MNPELAPLTQLTEIQQKYVYERFVLGFDEEYMKENYPNVVLPHWTYMLLSCALAAKPPYNHTYQCLDKGFVQYKRHMGDDYMIAEVARIWRAGKQPWPRLLAYLIKNKHTSPFEHGHIMFYVKAPLFVARQIMRHRTANVNEISGRYLSFDVTHDFYVPNTVDIALQSASMLQGRGESMTELDANYSKAVISGHTEQSMKIYTSLIKMGMAREIARMVLPVNIYTEFAFTIDLHNLMHFLSLRMKENAQYETRVYADSMFAIASKLFPIVMGEWEKNYQSKDIVY